MSLTAQEVRWVAHLARLELTDAELETLTRQLAAIVEYVDLLQQAMGGLSVSQKRDTVRLLRSLRQRARGVAGERITEGD